MIGAATQSQMLWYLTRGSGLIALVLLTASVVLGILEVKRWSTERWPRFVTAGLHKNISLLSVVFLVIHIATTVVDGFAPIGWLDAVIPFRSPYRPLWLGLGAVAVDLLIALTVSSLLRGRIGHRAWRAIHWAAYACWPVAALHGMGTGTDTKLGLVLALNLVCLAAVVLAVWWRVADAWSEHVVRTGAAVAAAVASVAVPVAIVAFLLAGPLQPGWSRRAGTPSIATSAIAATSTPSSPPGLQAGPAGSAAASTPSQTSVGSGSAFAGAFTDALTGTLQQSADGSSVTIDGTLTGAAPGHLRVVLQGQPASGGGIVMRASAVSLGPTARPDLYQGSVRALAGSQMQLAVAVPGGASVQIGVQLNLDGTSNVTGTVTGGTAASGGGGND
jgi:sulfoxide reductase heme-binding subunit YedZ